MKLLVLGGTRFLGRHLVDAALARGHDVTIFTRGVTPLPSGVAVRQLVGNRDPRIAPGLAALAADLDRNLIGGAADAPRPHLERGHDVAQRRFGVDLTLDGKAEVFTGPHADAANPMLTREYRSTYRDRVSDTEQLVVGRWRGRARLQDGDRVGAQVEVERTGETLGQPGAGEVEVDVEGETVRINGAAWVSADPDLLALTLDDGVNSDVVRAYTQLAKDTGARMTFGWDGANNLRTVKNALGDTVTSVFDSENRQVSTIDELPPGRRAVATRLISAGRRAERARRLGDRDRELLEQRRIQIGRAHV